MQCQGWSVASSVSVMLGPREQLTIPVHWRTWAGDSAGEGNYPLLIFLYKSWIAKGLLGANVMVCSEAGAPKSVMVTNLTDEEMFIPASAPLGEAFPAA